MSLKFPTLLFLSCLCKIIACEKSENWTSCSLSENDQATIAKWENISDCMDRKEVSQYYCKTLEYQLEEWDDWNSHVVGTGNRVSSTLGLLGSALTVLLLYSPKTRKRFADVSFTYLKIIALLELVEKVFFVGTWTYGDYWPKDHRVFALDVISRIDRMISRGSTMYVDVVTVGMGIERVVNLLAPLHYSSVHNKKFLLAVNLVGIATIPLFIPRAIEDGQQVHLDKDGKCCTRIRKPRTSTTMIIENIKDVIWPLMTMVILISSIAVILGLLKSKKKRDVLLGRQADRATRRKQREEEKERQRNIRLSILLLSLSVPVVTYGTLRIFDGYFSRYLYVQEDAVSKLCYKDAIDHLNLDATAQIVDMFQDLTHRIAHDSNFYLYILFFLPFREALVRLFRKNQVEPFTDAGTTGKPSRTAGGRGKNQEEDAV